MIIRTKPALADRIRALLDQARPDVVPGRLLAWWGANSFPSGAAPAPPLTQQQWEGLYLRLENGALEPGAVMPQARLEGQMRDVRPDGPLPVVIASFDVAVPRDGIADGVLSAASNGAGPAGLPRRLADAIQTRRAFMATAYLHDQWAHDIPVHRGRDVKLKLDERFHLTNPGGALPDAVAIDLGEGFHPVAWGDVVEAHYPTGDSAEIAIRCTYAGDEREARFTVAISDEPAPPRPDDIWELHGTAADGTPTEHGRAWVFRVPGRREVVNPVILVEGFPGGHPCDYMYELLNASGLVDQLRASGYDLVIVGLDNGLARIQRNADVLVDCIRKTLKRTQQPVVVGGVSMGGVISRYALARMEHGGDGHEPEDHRTRVYLSIDAPHGGTYTSLGVQWFVKALAPYAPSLASFARLIDSDSNVQLMIAWWDGENVGRGALRDELLEDLAAVGDYPSRPSRLAVSCGRGDGVPGTAMPGTPTLVWKSEPFVSIELNTLPGPAGAVDGLVAGGSWLVADEPLRPMRNPQIRAWEAVPGSQNAYNARMAQVATAFGCGTVRADPANALTCCVPTTSALGLDPREHDPSQPVGPKGIPFGAYTCSSANRLHLALEPGVTKWIVEQIGAPPPRASSGARTPAPPAGAPVFNPYAADFFQNPYPTYARMRAVAPPTVGGRLWFFRYADCEQVLQSTETFLKQPAGPVGIFGSDPPLHTRLREQIEPPFSTAVRAAPALAEAYVTQAIGAVAPTGHMDVLADFADRVAANIFMDMLGIPSVDREDIRRWETAILGARGDLQPKLVKFAGATAEGALRYYIAGLVSQCQAGGGQPGLVADLSKQIGVGLVAEDVARSCYDFMAAGHLSTGWLIASGLLSLLRHPDQFRELQLAPAKMDKAVQEILRYEPPFQLVARVAANDTQVGETEVPFKQQVVAVVGSANRDPAAFTGDPEVLDIDRAAAKPQLSFGDGIHRCIGEPLARAVAPIALEALMSRLPGLNVDGVPQWQASDPVLRFLTSFRVRFAA
jgi:cytochrome P450